ncbi:unnamed protein product, partial [Leptidea sinapis]
SSGHRPDQRDSPQTCGQVEGFRILRLPGGPHLADRDCLQGFSSLGSSERHPPTAASTSTADVVRPRRGDQRQPIRVFAFYKPPQNRIAVADVHTLLDSPLPTILAGDFNAKYTAGNSNITPTGRRRPPRLRGASPTHYPYCAAHMPDLIDIAVTYGLAAAPSLDVLDDHLISNHQTVLLALKTAPMTTSLPSPKHRQDWRIFAEHMAGHSPSFRVESPADVDRFATDLSATASNALRESRLDAASTRRQPQLPAYIQAMIEEKRKLRRQWQNLRIRSTITITNSERTNKNKRYVAKETEMSGVSQNSLPVMTSDYTETLQGENDASDESAFRQFAQFYCAKKKSWINTFCCFLDLDEKALRCDQRVQRRICKGEKRVSGSVEVMKMSCPLLQGEYAVRLKVVWLIHCSSPIKTI